MKKRGQKGSMLLLTAFFYYTKKKELKISSHVRG